MGAGVIADRRDAIVAAIRERVPELERNVHPYRPDVIVPPCAFVDRVSITRDRPTMVQLSFTATVLVVADGVSFAARRQLDETTAAVWLAVTGADCTPESTVDVTVAQTEQAVPVPGPVYPAVQLTVSTHTHRPIP